MSSNSFRRLQSILDIFSEYTYKYYINAIQTVLTFVRTGVCEKDTGPFLVTASSHKQLGVTPQPPSRTAGRLWDHPTIVSNANIWPERPGTFDAIGACTSPQSNKKCNHPSQSLHRSASFCSWCRDGHTFFDQVQEQRSGWAYLHQFDDFEIDT